MLKIKGSENCDYIELLSPEIDDLLVNKANYDSIEIVGKYNCANEFTVTQPLNVIDSCGFSSNENIYNVSLAFVKQSNLSISEISIKHITTGQIIKSTVNINFDAYKAQCPSGCPLQNVISYQTIFYSAFRTMLNNNGLDYSTLQVNICGDVLQIIGLPNGFIPNNIVYSNSTSDSFDNGFDNAFISLTDNLIISPSMFNITRFIDGVYGFKVKIKDVNGNTVEIENCYFLDCMTKCKVAAKAEFILESNEDEYSKNLAKDLLVAHYALITASNCGGCNCVELCALYDNLKTTLVNGNTNFNNQIIETDCGCSGK